jgi:hypothetical protein
MKKKTTPKTKTKNKTEACKCEEASPVEYVALTFLGRFFLAGLFIRKAFVCLFKGHATV